MSLTPWLPTVRRIKDGESVEQATVNTPIDQLTQRDQHLYEKFNEITGKSVLISFAQPIHPQENLSVGELSIVYFKSDAQGAGIAKGTTGFSSGRSSMFTPNNSNYSFGLLKTVYPESSTADLYTEGLCELTVPLNDPNLGLIQKNANGVVEEFAVGPYFLSSSSNGKITKNPSGIPVYIGYALSPTKFLLHTNVDEFSQFFINYRYHVLDRVAGVPSLDGDTWTIADPDDTKLGWLPVIDGEAAGVSAPEGAVFYYNIPAPPELDDDTALEDFEREEALELAKYLPPVPENFIQLFSNGTLSRYKDAYDLLGDFSVNEYGLWWYKAEDGQQPWSVDYPASGPDDWETIKDTIAASRKNLFASFSKFNPALRTQLVSSLKPFDTTTNKASNFIKFYNADNLLESSKSGTGDLLVDIIAPVNNVVTEGFTSGTAVADFMYSKPLGAFQARITPIVAKIQGLGKITVAEESPNSGVWNIDYAAQGSTGPVDSIEPINSRLEFRGLSSYIKLPMPSLTEFGLIGKIILAKGFPTGKALNLVFHLFGDVGIDVSSDRRKVAFRFEYTSVKVGTETALIGTNPIAAAQTVEFDLATGLYTAFTANKIAYNNSAQPLFTIPGTYVGEDTVISFKIRRVLPATANQGYGFSLTSGGNVGVLGIYWEAGA
jgi:hypothetical protein